MAEKISTWRLSEPELGTEVILGEHRYRCRRESTRGLTDQIQALLMRRGDLEEALDGFADALQAGSEEAILLVRDRSREAEEMVLGLLDAALYPRDDAPPAGGVIDALRDSGDISDKQLEEILTVSFRELEVGGAKRLPPARAPRDSTTSGRATSARGQRKSTASR